MQINVFKMDRIYCFWQWNYEGVEGHTLFYCKNTVCENYLKAIAAVQNTSTLPSPSVHVPIVSMTISKVLLLAFLLLSSSTFWRSRATVATFPLWCHLRPNGEQLVNKYNSNISIWPIVKECWALDWQAKQPIQASSRLATILYKCKGRRKTIGQCWGAEIITFL